MTKKTTSLKIDEELWKKFKIKCINNGKDLSQVIEELIKQEVKK